MIPPLGLISPIACPPPPGQPQQGTPVAAGTRSFHALLTPMPTQSCGFWLWLAESLGSVVKLEAKAGGRAEQQPGASVPCLSLGKPISAEASDPSDPITHPAPSLFLSKTRPRGFIHPSPTPLRASE